MKDNLWKNRNFSPMLLTEIEEPFNSKDYIYEVKFDGIRALLFVSPNEFKIQSRNKFDMTYLYPELKSIQNMVKEEMIIDGEIVIMDEENKPSFSLLQKRSHLKDVNKIKISSRENPVTFVAFDVLYNGKNLIDKSLTERKKVLNKLKENDVLVISRTYNDGVKLFRTIKELNLEGIVAKKKDSTYQINKRVDEWLKIKNIKDGDFYIGGYTIKKGNYISLLLGEFKDNKLKYVGNVTITKNNPIYKKILEQKVISKTPFIDFIDKNSTYILSKLNCTVTYLEKTKSGKLRHPTFKKLN